jgi:hypothetical protein
MSFVLEVRYIRDDLNQKYEAESAAEELAKKIKKLPNFN